jgi:hypothetical protein
MTDKALKYENMGINFSSVLFRLRDVMNVRNDGDIATRLGMAPRNFATCKARNRLPVRNIIKYAIEHKIDINYLLSGESSHAA